MTKVAYYKGCLASLSAKELDTSTQALAPMLDLELDELESVTCCGGQILRPSKLLGFEDPDRPWSLEAIIEACGGEAIDYPAKIKCCGFPIIQAREDVAMGELIQPIEQASEAGADAMVTPCPLCHLSLDAWQSKLKATTGRDFKMPILHLSQLVGVAAGLEESELKFKRHVVSVDPVLEKLEV